MRLDKYIADAAALTRSASRAFIKNKSVSVDGKIVCDVAMQIKEDSIVLLCGEAVSYKKNIYLMLNKPAGVITATEDKNQKTVMDIIDPSFERYKLAPVGRLDIDTEGFLLLTNDGQLAHNLLSPKRKVGKTYFVRLAENISDSDMARLEEGVDIGECITKPAKTQRICENEINLTITEGKFHQIKRMAHAVNNEVVYLKRLSYGKLFLDEGLSVGEYRPLTEDEIALLHKNTDII